MTGLLLKHISCPPDYVEYNTNREIVVLSWEFEETSETFRIHLGVGILKASPFERASLVLWAGGNNRVLHSRLKPYPFETRAELYEFYSEANYVIDSFKGVN
jgi:hypothetical protein